MHLTKRQACFTGAFAPKQNYPVVYRPVQRATHHKLRRSRQYSPYAARLADNQAVAAQDAATQHTGDQEVSALQDLLVWLVNNGVTGIGHDDSPLALYEDEDGDRGILAEQDIPAGEVLVRVPLRLAITDVMSEEQRQRVVGQGAMWQDRLVSKLLQEVQKGNESPWHPYLQALPQVVPSALNSFTPQEADQLQLPDAVGQIKGHEQKMADSWASCRPDAIGGADLDKYRWAHTIVMSRTFGNASPTGGVGVRMCVPLIDMLNHAGDEAEGGLLSSTDIIARDNVRWDVVSPDNSASGAWEMVLSSTRPIAAGDPLLLSYREGPNEEFLLCYGFVPPSNPHDTVELFGNLSTALEHLWEQDLSQGRTPDSGLRQLYSSAHDAGLQALQDEVMATAAGVSDSSSLGQLLEALEPVKVASGSRVSGPMIATLEVLHSGDMSAVGAAVASLAWQQLQALPTTLLWDLAWLVQDGLQGGDGQQVQLYGSLLKHYVQALTPAYAPELGEKLMTAAASNGNNSNAIRSPTSSSGSSGSTTGLGQRKKRFVPGPPPDQQQQQQQQSQPGPADVSQLPAASLLSVASIPLQALASAVLQQQQQQQQQAELWFLYSSSSSNPTSVEQPPEQQQQQQQQLHVINGCRPAELRLAVKFRVNKKMLLTDVLLAAPVPLEQLEQQRQQLAAYRLTAAAANIGRDDSADDLLPWLR